MPLLWSLIMIFLCFSCSNDVTLISDGLVINEIMVRNTSSTGILAPNGKAEDWIELYNIGDDTLDLSDYFLSDDTTDLVKANLPSILLYPKEFITLWCGEKGNMGDLFLGFNLSEDIKNGDYIFLTNKSLTVIDSCNYLSDSSSIKKGASYGRLPDGGARWSQQKYPSPSSTNNG